MGDSPEFRPQRQSLDGMQGLQGRYAQSARPQSAAPSRGGAPGPGGRGYGYGYGAVTPVRPTSAPGQHPMCARGRDLGVALTETRSKAKQF